MTKPPPSVKCNAPEFSKMESTSADKTSGAVKLAAERKSEIDKLPVEKQVKVKQEFIETAASTNSTRDSTKRTPEVIDLENDINNLLVSEANAVSSSEGTEETPYVRRPKRKKFTEQVPDSTSLSKAAQRKARKRAQKQVDEEGERVVAKRPPRSKPPVTRSRKAATSAAAKAAIQRANQVKKDAKVWTASLSSSQGTPEATKKNNIAKEEKAQDTCEKEVKVIAISTGEEDPEEVQTQRDGEDDDELPPSSGLKSGAKQPSVPELAMIPPPSYKFPKQTTLTSFASVAATPPVTPSPKKGRKSGEDSDDMSVTSSATDAASNTKMFGKLTEVQKQDLMLNGLKQVVESGLSPSHLTRFTFIFPKPQSTRVFEAEATEACGEIFLKMIKADPSLTIFPYFEKESALLAYKKPTPVWMKRLSVKNKMGYFNNFKYQPSTRFRSHFLNCLLGHSLSTKELVEEVNPALSFSSDKGKIMIRSSSLISEKADCIGMLFGSCYHMGIKDLEQLINRKLEATSVKVELRDKFPSGMTVEIEASKQSAEKYTGAKKTKFENAYKIFHVYVDSARVNAAKRYFEALTHRGQKFINGSVMRLIPEADSREINSATKAKLRHILKIHSVQQTCLHSKRCTCIDIGLDDDLGLKEHKGLTMRQAIMKIPRSEGGPNDSLFYSVGFLDYSSEIIVTYLPSVVDEASSMIDNLVSYFIYAYGSEVEDSFTFSSLQDAEGREWDPKIGGVVGDEDKKVSAFLDSLGNTVDDLQIEFDEAKVDSGKADAKAMRLINQADDISTLVPTRMVTVNAAPSDNSILSSSFTPHVLQVATGNEQGTAGGNSSRYP